MYMTYSVASKVSNKKDLLRGPAARMRQYCEELIYACHMYIKVLNKVHMSTAVGRIQVICMNKKKCRGPDNGGFSRYAGTPLTNP